MASIQTDIELNDGFVNTQNEIIDSANRAISAIEDMQSTMSADIDTSSLDSVRSEIEQTTIAVSELERAASELTVPEVEIPQADTGAGQVINVDMNPVISDPFIPNPQEIRPEVIPNAPPEPVNVPVEWKTDGLDIFTSSGADRFQQEVQSANTMLEQLSSTQDAIAKQAFNTNIFPPQAFQNLNSMAVRVDNIRERIQKIENNPVNIGSDTANSELERLRALLNQMLNTQNDLSTAMDSMDVSAANEAYMRLSKTVSGTEQYLRDNVDEQGRFNSEIDKGANSAGNLGTMIDGAAKALEQIDGVEKAIDWIKECTEAFDVQRNAELQLMAVLANNIEAEVTADASEAAAEINGIQNRTGAVTVAVSADTQTLNAAFDTITAKASEIQSNGIYSDEVMIAGAAELSMHFSDTAAIEMMMDTLADYAMGVSGGGELDSSTMAAYASELAQSMSGAYDAMSQKGFKFTEAQRAVIEGTATQEQIIAAIGEEYLNMSEDVQAAAAINSVVAQSWGGLYESMSNGPQGKIIQMTNAWGSMKEMIGGQLYPYVILFVDAIMGHWGTIQSVLDGITLGLQIVMGSLSWLLEGALNFAQAVIDNWGRMGPVIGTVAGAVAVLAAIFIAYKAAMGIAAVAQALFNTTLLGCPIVWILLIIMAVIVAIYAIVEAVNNATGSTYSALGVICGVLMVAAAYIGNLFVTLINSVIDVFVVLWNFIAAFANFFANVFTDPVGAIARLFFDLVDCILGLLETLASVIDTMFGLNLASTVAGWRDDLGGWVDETFGQGEEIMTKVDASSMHLEQFDYDAAWDAGYSFGEGIDESIAGVDPSSIFGTTDEIPGPEDYAPQLEDMSDGLEGISNDTGNISDSLETNSEELKYLRDIAEQEAINRFTTAEIKIEQTNHNTIKSDMDLDGVVSSLTDMMGEAVESAAEGVHE